MKRSVYTAVILSIVLLVAVTGAWIYCQPKPAVSPESISVGVPPTESAALLYIADEQGFFAANGLNVTLRNYSDAVRAVQGMERSDVDLSVSSEYQIVAEVLAGENLSVVSTIDKYQAQYLVGRKDKGIETVSDLKGKKIGIHREAIAEFYLAMFLSLHGISPQDVTLVDVKPSKSADAIANGEVDAIQLRDLELPRVEQRLGSNMVSWPAQSNQSTHMVMASQSDWILRHPDTLDRLLRSLEMAEDYNLNHPAEAKAIVQHRQQADQKYLDRVWPDHQFSLSLDQSLITVMENEGRWLIASNLTEQNRLPDFRKYVYTKSLRGVDPEAVNIW